MDNLDLKTLGLAKKWPKLDRLQREVGDLQKRLSVAEGQVRILENQLNAAREKELVAAAEALRRDKDVPVGVHEASAKRQLAAAAREKAILEKAVEGARADLAQFMAKHQGALYEAVAGARADIASECAKSAQEALRAYSRYEDLAYVLKGLQPPVEVEDWTGPPNPNSVSIIGVATRQSQGPERGHVEGILQHLISLAEPPAGDPGSPALGDPDAA